MTNDFADVFIEVIKQLKESTNSHNTVLLNHSNDIKKLQKDVAEIKKSMDIITEFIKRQVTE